MCKEIKTEGLLGGTWGAPWKSRLGPDHVRWNPTLILMAVELLQAYEISPIINLF